MREAAWGSSCGLLTYKAEGFRLPTSAEWFYVATKVGRSMGKYYFGYDGAKIKDHVWYSDNSGGQTQAVEELFPLIIGQSHFYDILGNVVEYTFDSTLNDKFSGDNPLGADTLSIPEFKVRGSHFSHSFSFVNSLRSALVSDLRSPRTGFRLVRSLPPGTIE